MEQKKIHLTIDGHAVSVESGKTVFDAAQSLNIKIPTLCHHPDLCIAGNCRVCVVEQEGARTLTASCATPAADGMVIHTNTQKVRTTRKHIIELLLSEHNSECLKCYKNGNCELQQLAAEYKITHENFISLLPFHAYTIDDFSPSIIKDDSKCIRCQRCVRTCEELQSVSALSMAYKGEKTKVSTFLEKSMVDVVCTNCGQCINRCPTGALVEKNCIDQVWDAIYDKDIHVVVQTAPAIRIALGEEFGIDPGGIVTGKMVAAMKKMGFDSVMDTDFTADLTIMEEGTELLLRLKDALVEKKEVALPMMTSCSPGWIKFLEHQYPSLLPNLSTCKSPQQMFGALAKTFYAQKRNLNPAKVVSVSVMPCTAKKFEADRPEMYSSGYKDVDFVLTTRELAIMMKQAGIDFNRIEDSHYDTIMGESSGAAVIFGASGGVMEAALRTAYELITGREVPFENLDIVPVRGMEGIKEASVKIEGTVPEWSFLEGATVHLAIAHGLVNAKTLMDKVASGEANYHFIEIMACPGGCLGGGGQPIPTSPEIRLKRNKAIYQEDKNMNIRKSHENQEVMKLYDEFLEKPCGHKSHKLLHTHYTDRSYKYN